MASFLVSLALCLAMLMISPTYVQGDLCSRKNGVLFGNQCLTFSDEELSWFEAKDACINKGGILAPLIDRKQAIAVNAYLVKTYGDGSDHNDNFWAGASDLAQHGTWRWITGELFSSDFPWGPGDPNSSPERPEHCLMLNYFVIIVDARCEWKSRYICDIGIRGGPVVRILFDNRDGPHADGSYSFNFELEDGTSVQEQGYPTDSGTVAREGSYTLTYPDGTVGEFKWIADENGFRVESPLLPTPPPIPPHAQVV